MIQAKTTPDIYLAYLVGYALCNDEDGGIGRDELKEEDNDEEVEDGGKGDDSEQGTLREMHP